MVFEIYTLHDGCERYIAQSREDAIAQFVARHTIEVDGDVATLDDVPLEVVEG